MPYYPKLNLLFLHIPKNAGGSVEKALSRLDSGPSDSVQRRFGIIRRIVRKIFREINARYLWDEQFLYGRDFVPVTMEHLTYREISSLDFLGSNLQECRVFFVKRNPFDRLVSLYNSHNRSMIYGDFEAFVDNWLLSDSRWCHDEWSHKRRQVDYFNDLDLSSDRVDVLPFESFSSSFPEYLNELGFNCGGVPHAHQSGRPKQKWVDFYQDSRLRSRVVDYYREDFDRLDYDWRIN